MDLKIGDVTVSFAHDDDAEGEVAVVELPAWRGYTIDLGREEWRGARVPPVLAPADPAGFTTLAAASHGELIDGHGGGV